MIAHFNFKRFGNNEYLLTNDFGDFLFLSAADFEKLVNHTDALSAEVKERLSSSRMIIEGSVHHFVDANTPYARDSKNYTFTATSLHIFVVTNQCNQRCVYCQASDGHALYHAMDERTAERAVDVALQSPSNQLSFEFQGGEPLLNFGVIKHIVQYTEQKNSEKDISFTLVSNLTLLTDEMVSFIKEHRISIATSLDGNEVIHNANRPFADGSGSFERVIQGVRRLRDSGISIGAIQTTTRASLPYASEIVDTYCQLGFSSVFIRPLSPLGCAKKNWTIVGYSEEQFVRFYVDAFLEIIKRNRNGIRIQENYSAILLSNILHKYPANYMELRSPCGAGIGQLAYYVNGDVFTCDEGRMLYEMGTGMFRLGNVHENSLKDLIQSPVCRAVCLASTTETLPSCCDCVYQPYCGVCPVVNYALYGDLIPKEANHYRCKINMGILDFLFSVLHHGDKETKDLLRTWRL
ncbi:MAG: His-Xaa-Ser system radical SAM maturase HxsB [Ruminococcaceae bacterium]|jgi:His-Xaa-Ser repeat-associated upstream radical SAM protein|nr:His-Xaa-Ser system radical SAM maturase HxsB [Oscillospiraceae bacterium]